MPGKRPLVEADLTTGVKRSQISNGDDGVDDGSDSDKSCKRVSLSPFQPKQDQYSGTMDDGGTKYQGGRDGDGENDDDDDSEVEFLFTKPGPSPLCGVSQEFVTAGMPQQGQQQEQVTSTSYSSSSSMPDMTSFGLAKNSSSSPFSTETTMRSAYAAAAAAASTPVSASATDEFHSSDATRESPSNLTPSQPLNSSMRFKPRSSAYLQSLAEICHAILWDARWRVPPRRPPSVGRKRPVSSSSSSSSSASSLSSSTTPPPPQRLFSWERGDDLSVVHALSRKYVPLPHFLEKKTNDKESTSTEQRDRWRDDDDDTTDAEEDSELDQCLELYSRLYFRKGPWFRLDDIYTKYYLPTARKRHQHLRDEERLPHTSEQHGTTGTVLDKKDDDKNSFVNNTSSFFQPNSQSTNRRNKNSKAVHGIGDDKYFDQEFLQMQLQTVADMILDVKHLHDMGMVRSFQSEAECGKAVSFLTQEEQKVILTKLGAKRRTASMTSPSIGCDSDNLIWRQMCQQRAIFQSFTSSRNGKKEQQVLPVIKHVNQLLLEKWANTIVRACSKVEYVPSARQKAVTAFVLCKLRQHVTAVSERYNFSMMPMCVRLREAPLVTLRRCCRLYLCATSGPGDMRGDGLNGWRSLPDSHDKDLRNVPMRTNVVSPPGSHSWHLMSYPGRDWRLRLSSCSFVKAHVPIYVNDVAGMNGNTTNASTDFDDTVHVFNNVESFLLWELVVELRANGDYLLELNDLIHYESRKEAREKEDDAIDCKEVNVNYNHDDDDDNASRCPSFSESEGSIEESKVDFMDLLTIAGRAKVVQKFVGNSMSGMETLQSIECYLSDLLVTPLEDQPLLALHVMSINESPTSQCRLKNECERVLGVLAVIIIHLLENRSRTAQRHEVERASSRPWLRHMYWEGCAGYLLWDLIPILEKRGYYDIAVKSLEILLFGRRLARRSGKVLPDNLVVGTEDEAHMSFGQLFLSRRARGKAYDRLIIDYTHILRQNSAAIKKITETANFASKGRKRSRSPKKEALDSSPNEAIAQLTKPLLQAHLATGQITFSAARTLARRLKQPLEETLKDTTVFEVSELGHRLSNGNKKAEAIAKKYTDWTPETDTAIANSLSSNQGQAGGRCAYVGFEEDNDNTPSFGSLNVEELAKEYYFSGRLPNRRDESGSSNNGGWVGWHDEGGKIRALFRILSSETLGMDCAISDKAVACTPESSSIFLTPYQGAPFDLHVGAQVDTTCGKVKNGQGFYMRRKKIVEDFLSNLSRLNYEELSNLVYDCIATRLEHAKASNHIDSSLERDVENVRTFSFLASGFGGSQLANAMRCLFFDYRHYSGGLPDLLLCRATYKKEPEAGVEAEFVDLGDWVGETFSVEYQAAMKSERATKMLEDRDDDFLGCSKVGDSGGRAGSNRFRRNSARAPGPTTRNDAQKDEPKKVLEMPERLTFFHRDRRIVPECMFVEVKSHNDRLDARQEDWLNILDMNGNARVCKFTKPPKPAKVKKSKPSKAGISKKSTKCKKHDVARR